MKRWIKNLGKERLLSWIVGMVIGALAGALIVAFFFVADRSLALLEWSYWLDAGDISGRSEVVRNIGLVVAAFVAGGLAVWRSVINQRQARAAEQGQITNRYSEAVKMLSEDNARTRTGAVYALARIARDSIERDHIPVMEVLAEFIRNPPYRYQEEAAKRAERRNEVEEAIDYGVGPDEGVNLDIGPPIQCPDIHAALNVIADRNGAQRAREKAAGVRLSFWYAALQELDLRSAKFPGADLDDANLTGANLTGAAFAGANLAGADLTGADLTDARLWGANLSKAVLTGANLNGADVSGADLTSADLTDARLWGANLTGASLTNADLRDAALGDAKLAKATGLTQEQITVCQPGRPPIDLPHDLEWPFAKKSRHRWVKKV